MKKKIFLSAGLALAVAGLVGCKTGPESALGGLLQGRQVIATNQVETPVVERSEIVSTAEDGTATTNVVTVTNVVSRTITTTNVVWETAPVVKESLDAVNFVAPAIPPPFGQAITFGTGIATVLLGFIAKRKNREAQSLAQQVAAVVKGVEEASAALPEGNKIKEVIRDNALRLGIASELHQTVRKLT